MDASARGRTVAPAPNPDVGTIKDLPLVLPSSPMAGVEDLGHNYYYPHLVLVPGIRLSSEGQELLEARILHPSMLPCWELRL